MPAPFLPAPDAAAMRHSAALIQHIREDIRAHGGSIDFMRYMELALYAPGLGYYSAGPQKFGANGDFITAPEMGSAFARCLARQCAQVFQQLGKAEILEVGAGSGKLAADLLSALAQQGQLPHRYLILELSADLRARQAAHVAKQIPELASRIEWLDQLPAREFRGVIIANELLDAIPTQRFRVLSDGLRLLHVAWENDGFVWREVPAPTSLAAQVASRIDFESLPAGYTSEINLQAEAWIRSMGQIMDAGLLLLIDYGFPRSEFYHPDRSDGTMMCHFRHQAHSDPFVLIGLQDITTHVEFTALAEAGHESGLALLGYTSQAAFLLATGIAEQPAEPANGDLRSQLELAQEIKKLTLPHEMGELFKVLALARGLSGPLLGFVLQDRRSRL